ncbi:MAG: hypothetical protein KDC54_05665, partial [Lewinella sp.]|nr:hypothetical protein [Lewinella sp.]
MPYRIIQLVLFTGGLLLTFGASTVIAQPDFLLQARTVEAGVAVNWTPTEPSTWANLLPTGYQVSRVEIDANGNPLGAVQTLRDRTIPRDSAWFVENRQLEDGLIEPIGFLLYDSTFMFPENELMDETAMKFNFIVYETTLSAPIAEAVGLGITDTEVEPGRSYRYTVQALDGSLRGSIDITVQPRTFVQSPADFVMEFEFPEQTSLSDMLAAVRPGEIEMVRGLAKAYGDSIVLRWGPSSPRLWDLAKRDGYKIHRAQGDAEPEVIAEVFPWTEDQVTPAISGDSMALLAASILFQDRARIAEQNLSFAEEARLFTNAQGFALYAADRSPLAAEILGLRYVDHDVVPGEAYLYFVSTAALEDPILWARFLIVNEYESLPAPFDFRVAAQDKALKLVWNKDINRTRYSAYRLERSSDGENFFPVTEDPMIFAEDPRIPLSEYSYIDSLGVNGQTFYYRLYGSNSFGEWSEAATGYGLPRDLTPPPPALIADGTYNDSLRQFALRWLPADPPVADLAAYQVMMSNKADGFYSAISPLLSPSDYTYSFNISEEMDTDRAFYFKVQSFDQSGNASPSLEHQIIVPDWTPPLPPPAITGTIDSAGRVTVSWEPSPAADLRGYWLYWGNYEDEELTAISQDIILGTECFWYLEEASLNESIFVCVRAEDDNFNLSETSPLAEIKRPDRVPPIPPMMEVAV